VRAPSNNPISGGSTYERELYSRAECRVVGSPPGIDGHDAKSVDRYDHWARNRLVKVLTISLELYV